MLAKLMSYFLLGLVRVLTGSQARWYGCPPKAEQRIYFANHQSHADLVMIWAALPKELRARTRAIAAKDYWTRTPFKQWLTTAVFNVIYVSRDRSAAAAVFMSLREFDETAAAQRRNDLHNFEGVLKTSWFMGLVFWIGWLSGDWVALTLFGFVSFFALREFMTLSPTRRGDHRSLVLAFFVVLPLQYGLVGTEHFDLFTVFIPVYVFLAIPVASALANDPQRFLERNTKLQWGIMVCIYGMSHVPALLLLDFPDYDKKSAFLVFFLVLVVQTCMLVQHLASRRLRRAPAAPNISQSFNWPSWWIGIAVGSVLGGLLAGITPFVPGQAFAMAFVACVAGSLGHLVMKALKRDRGIPIWRGQGTAVTGAGGLLDRVDALCFAAPVFFHSTRWYFGL